MALLNPTLAAGRYDPRLNFDFGGGFGPGPGTIGTGGPVGGPGGGGGVVISLPGGGGSGGFTGGATSASTLGLASWFLGIDWGRIAAFLLGLLLIAGGIYLIKPVQQAINVTVKEGAKAAAKGAAEAAAA